MGYYGFTTRSICEYSRQLQYTNIDCVAPDQTEHKGAPEIDVDIPQLTVLI